jgi:hypothetical protein
MANHDEVRTTGPGGWGVVLKAQNALILVIMAAALAAMIWAQRADRAQNLKTFDAAVVKVEETLTLMRLEHVALLEACHKEKR